MSNISTVLISYVTIALTAFIVNIPLGYLREGSPKFSFKWIFWIHASIPLIIYLRISMGISSWFISVSIFLAVLGQIIGGRQRRKFMTEAQKEELMQIPPIETNNLENLKDQDVLVALLNMGGPKTNADVKEFQHRIFSDALLIRFPLSMIFQKLFAFILVTFRSKAAAERYQLIGGGSPIYPSTEAQVAALSEELKRRARDLRVTYAFNYSPPLPADTVREAKESGKKAILPLSLYPHYSKATTGSNLHYLKAAAADEYPGLKFLTVPNYHLHEGYVSAFADRIREQVRPGEALDDFYLLFSAHGLPMYFLTEGDPYPFQISQTVANVLANIERHDRWAIAYQSAVGPLQWLKPSTEDMIKALAKRGKDRVIIIPISFVNDHIETTVEIDMEYRVVAKKAGIRDFRMTKAIECHPGFIKALADTVEQALPKPEHWTPRADGNKAQVSSRA